MAASSSKSPPATNLAGLRKHWRNDAIAGFSVALVALPLALGIATAAGAPPTSGVVSAIVAGLLATFLRGSQVAINGPGNSLIVIIAGAFAALGGPEAFPHVLGAVVVAGGVQVALGLLRLGKMGDLVPPAVIQGMLAAIGLIIVGKQAHVLVGHEASGSPVEAYTSLPASILDLDPAAAIIGAISLLILIVHPKITAKFVHFVPAPLWVVIFAVPAAFGFAQLHGELNALLGVGDVVGPPALVEIPQELASSLVTPDFSRIAEPAFWMVVVTLTLVTSIENIVSVKAVDKLDTYRRKSDLDRDLTGMGIASIVSGLIGGLPVLTVVARSSVNVNHGAKTGWSNFFASLLLLVFVVLLGPLIQQIPLAALAGILVYTGYKLAAPHVVRDALHKGPDHFLVFGMTLAGTLVWGLLWGIAIGFAAELLGHLLILNITPRQALTRLRETAIESIEQDDEPRVLRVSGMLSFLVIGRLRRALDGVADGEKVIVDFSDALLVDNTSLDYVHEFGRRYEQAHGAGRFEVIGLEGHRSVGDHPDAVHALDRRRREPRLTPRQERIAEAAEARGWDFDPRAGLGSRPPRGLRLLPHPPHRVPRHHRARLPRRGRAHRGARDVRRDLRRGRRHPRGLPHHHAQAAASHADPRAHPREGGDARPGAAARRVPGHRLREVREVLAQVRAQGRGRGGHPGVHDPRADRLLRAGARLPPREHRRRGGPVQDLPAPCDGSRDRGHAGLRGAPAARARGGGPYRSSVTASVTLSFCDQYDAGPPS